METGIGEVGINLKIDKEMKNNAIQSIADTAPSKGRSIQTLLASVSIPRLRTTVQACFTLFCIFVGYRFYCFYLWTLDRSETFVSRPPSVEGFLPISALLGLKRLALTGQWDPVHPAGLTIFIAALAIAFLFRKGFCGWICPVGFVSNLLEKTSTLTIAVIGFLVLISFVIRNFWCRYLCPYGALLGLLAIFSPVTVKRRASNCIDCKKCETICPASIRVARNDTVRHAECIGCVECVEVCPQENCLSLSVPGKKQMPIYIMPVAIVGLFGLFYMAAVFSGHWQSKIPLDAVKPLYQAAETFAHP
ncbi:MAG: 4Fe-4S binding protein [Acidobacteriota bacterium]